MPLARLFDLISSIDAKAWDLFDVVPVRDPRRKDRETDDASLAQSNPINRKLRSLLWEVRLHLTCNYLRYFPKYEYW